MDFKKIRIIEVGPTANDWTDEVNGELKTGKIVITPESLASLVVAGSIRPIHSRRTHNGNDLLDQYIGSFSNFVEENGVVYADLTFSEALLKNYPQEAGFMKDMIEKEPEMLGVSVVDLDTKVWNEENQTWDVTSFEELFTCDLVGLPAATSSLFNNQKSKNKMGLLSSIISTFSKKTELKEEIVETVNGEKITINIGHGGAESTAQQVGCLAMEEYLENTGRFTVNVYPNNSMGSDDELCQIPEEGKIVLVIKDGKIAEFKEYMDEKPEETPETETKTPDEFSQRLTALESSLSEIKTMLSKQTKTPPVATRTVGGKPKTDAQKTQLSNEEARKKAREAMVKFAKEK